VPTGNAFVPTGLSVWELSTEDDVRSKAEEDYEKRKQRPPCLDRSQTTFVFATPRKWLGKTKWCEEKNAEDVWRKVRVLDSADLEEWLECAPAVDAWLSRLLGNRPSGVEDIGEYWANLAALSSPSLRPEVFLLGRQKAVEQLTQWLAGPASVLAFEASAPSEVLDFLAARCAILEVEEREKQEARIVIISECEPWRALAASHNRLVLVASPRFSIEPELVVEAVRGGHHVLLTSHRFASDRAQTQSLPCPDRYDLEKELVASGLKEEFARRTARECAGNLTVLKRRITNIASTAQPEWSHPPNATALLPFILAGGWDDASEPDRDILEKLAGCPYRDVLITANRWLNSPDSPLLRVNTRWSMAAREDSWILLAPYLTREHLDVLDEVVSRVLGEDDPRYEMPAAERWLASIHGKVPKYSGDLRHALVETIALLGAKADTGLLATPLASAQRAAKMVRRLLPSDATWKRWASLDHCLELLAEASPEVFLEILESDLVNPQPQTPLLFTQEGDPLFSSSPHTGLLWALETLAWEPTLLSRVSLILAQLARRDPGGKLANRPARSLREIFLPWFPQTDATVEQRLGVLALLLRREPVTAWQLLLSLLPQGHDSATNSHQPRWRQWGLGWSRGVLASDYWKQVNGTVQLLVENIGNDGSRWVAVIKELEHFPHPSREQIIAALSGLDPSAFTVADREKIWAELHENVSRHRYYHDAEWAMMPETVDELERIKTKFEPENPVKQYAWLFNSRAHVAEVPYNAPWETQDAALANKRKEVLIGILAKYGFDTVRNLADAAERPWTIGVTLGKEGLLTDDSVMLPGLLTASSAKHQEMAQGFVLGGFVAHQWQWVQEQDLSGWTVAQRAKFAYVLPFSKRLWDWIATYGAETETEYWRTVQAPGYDLSVAEVEEGVSKLLAVSRPMRAIDVVCTALHNKRKVGWELIANVLEAGLRPQQASITPGDQIAHLQYEIQELFKLLQASPNIDSQRLAGLEWGYLPLLNGHQVSPKSLHAWLQKDPQFFAEVLGWIYHSKNELPDQRTEPTDKQRLRARHAHDLIHDWHSLPGATEDGTIDGAFLSQWIRAAREKCSQTGHSDICDVTIGELLAHAPTEKDGTWPCIAVREIIEEVGNDKLLSGFSVGIVNKRGATWRSHNEGGQQERALAHKYDAWAIACATEWPRTATVLRNTAKNYEAWAKREDEDIRNG